MVGDTQRLIQIINYFAKLKSQSVENAIERKRTQVRYFSTNKTTITDLM